MALFRDENRLVTEQSSFDNPAIRYIAYAIMLLLLSIIQLLFTPLIAIEYITPNLLIIFTVIIALREGQMIGLIAAFGAGLVYDVISLGVLGTNALAAILSVFLAGFFYKEGRFQHIVGSYRFLLIMLLTAFVYNLVYYFFYIQPTEIDFLGFFLKYGVAATLYTTVIAVVPMLYMARKSLY